MGICECSGDRGNEHFFLFTAAFALDCAAGALYLWVYRLRPLEAVLNQKFLPAPARLSQWLEHEKSIMGIMLQHRSGSRGTHFLTGDRPR